MRGVAAVAVASAVLAAAVGLVWWAPIGVLLLGSVAYGGVLWVRLLVVRDSRALIVLWLVFGLTRTAALLVPADLQQATLWLDDVALAVALAVVLATGRGTPRGPRVPWAVYAGMGLFAVSGVLSGLAADVGLPALGVGTWLGLKLLVALFVSLQFRWTEASIRAAFRVAAWLTAVVVVVAVVQVVAPAAVNAVFGAPQRTRLGGSVVTSIFREPAQYSAFCLLALSIVLGRHPITRMRGLAAVVVAGAALLSLRLKAVVDVVLLVSARAASSPAVLVRAGAPLLLGLVTAIAVYLGAGLIGARAEVLFGDDASPRQLLYRVAFQLAADEAPLGAGFGSFGSDASITYYSPVYAEYGLSATYGFSRSAPHFVHDASWATVLGEAGWLGALGVAVALLAVTGSLWSRIRGLPAGTAQDCARVGLLFTLVVLADSVTSPQLFAGFSVVSLAVLYSMALSTAESTAGSSAPEEIAGRTVGAATGDVHGLGSSHPGGRR